MPAAMVLGKVFIGISCFIGCLWGLHHRCAGSATSPTCMRLTRLLPFFGKAADSDVDTKDCYLDKECHAKVDWEKISKIKEVFFGHLKIMKVKKSRNGFKEMMGKVHTMCREADMPDDRIDYMLIKWVKFVYPEALGDKGECSKYESWGEKALEGCHSCEKWFPGKADQCMKCGESCAKYCPAGSDMKCYEGGEFLQCHEKCMMPAQDDKEVKVDTIALGGKDECSKYESWGEKAVEGCHRCEKRFPGKANQCMKCGASCAKYCPAGSDMKCYEGGEFLQCHKKCMMPAQDDKEVKVDMVTV